MHPALTSFSGATTPHARCSDTDSNTGYLRGYRLDAVMLTRILTRVLVRIRYRLGY